MQQHTGRFCPPYSCTQADLAGLGHTRRLVQRAQMLVRVRRGDRLGQVAAALGVNPVTVTLWVRRFNNAGMAGLVELPRGGRPATYTAEEIGTVIKLALTNPADLQQPFGSWTLDRLATYLHEEHDITMKRSRISEILQAEGLRWRTQEGWFGERVDPEFAAKRDDCCALCRTTRE